MVEAGSHGKIGGVENIIDSEGVQTEITAILKQIRDIIHLHKGKTHPHDVPEIEDLRLGEFMADLGVILEKRSLEILYFLHKSHHRSKALRFTELHQKMGDVGTSTLTSRLRDLEHKGIVKRKAYREIPPRVEYTLTERGRELILILALLFMWSAMKCETTRKPDD